jgi:hypothetical protein
MENCNIVLCLLELQHEPIFARPAAAYSLNSRQRQAIAGPTHAVRVRKEEVEKNAKGESSQRLTTACPSCVNMVLFWKASARVLIGAL